MEAYQTIEDYGLKESIMTEIKEAIYRIHWIDLPSILF